MSAPGLLCGIMFMRAKPLVASSFSWDYISNSLSFATGWRRK